MNNSAETVIYCNKNVTYRAQVFLYRQAPWFHSVGYPVLRAHSICISYRYTTSSSISHHLVLCHHMSAQLNRPFVLSGLSPRLNNKKRTTPVNTKKLNFMSNTLPAYLILKLFKLSIPTCKLYHTSLVGLLSRNLNLILFTMQTTRPTKLFLLY